MPRLNRNLSFLFVLNIAVSFSINLIQPLFPLYLASLDASEVNIGFVIASASLAATALMLPSGMMMDRVGRKRMMLISVILSTFPPFFIALLSDWRVVFPFYIVFNAAFPFFVPARMALIAENATPENRGSMFGLMNVAWPIGGILGPLLSGYLAESYGWGPPFLVCSAINGLSLFPALMISESGREEVAHTEPAGKASLMDRQYLFSMVLFFLFHLATATGLGGVRTILPIYLKNQLHLSTILIGLFFTSSSLLSLITQIPGGWLSDKYGRKRLIIACIIFIPLFFILWNFIDNWVTLLFLHTMAFGLWSLTWPATQALLSDSVPPELIGSAFGVRMTGTRLGFTLGPIIAVYLYSSLSHTSPFLTSSIFFIITIPISLLLKEYQRTKR